MRPSIGAICARSTMATIRFDVYRYGCGSCISSTFPLEWRQTLQDLLSDFKQPATRVPFHQAIRLHRDETATGGQFHLDAGRKRWIARWAIKDHRDIAATGAPLRDLEHPFAISRDRQALAVVFDSSFVDRHYKTILLQRRDL